MRTAIKLILGVVAAVAVAVATGATWLYFDESGLPDVHSMRAFVSPGATPSNVACLLGSPVVVSNESLGKSVRDALSATEASEGGPNVLTAVFASNRSRRRSVAMLLSRRMVCAQERPLAREAHELRTAIQLERHFSKRDLFTMTANTAYFGDGMVGVESASEHYFRSHSSELSIAEAALLAGLISHPTYYSPARHPDRALLRRNQVIDAMAGDGAISPGDAAFAKAAPIQIAPS